MRWFKVVALEDRARERDRTESGVLKLSSYTRQNSIITPANIYAPSKTFVTVIADTIQTNKAFWTFIKETMSTQFCIDTGLSAADR